MNTPPMSANEHTPGPWAILPIGCDFQILASNNEEVALCEGAENARLIAAAPTMFDALALVEHALAQPDADPREILALNSPIRQAIQDSLSAARAKEGGQP